MSRVTHEHTHSCFSMWAAFLCVPALGSNIIPRRFHLLFFSSCLFYYDLHSRLPSKVWLEQSHHSLWLLQHLSDFDARAQGVLTMCVAGTKKSSPEVMQLDQKRDLKCCLVLLGWANLSCFGKYGSILTRVFQQRIDVCVWMFLGGHGGSALL